MAGQGTQQLVVPFPFGCLGELQGAEEDKGNEQQPCTAANVKHSLSPQRDPLPGQRKGSGLAEGPRLENQLEGHRQPRGTTTPIRLRSSQTRLWSLGWACAIYEIPPSKAAAAGVKGHGGLKGRLLLGVGALSKQLCLCHECPLPSLLLAASSAAPAFPTGIQCQRARAWDLIWGRGS